MRSTLGILTAVVLAALLLKAAVVDAFRIPSPSMVPGLVPGDFVFVNKLVYGIRTPSGIPLSEIRLPTVRLPGLAEIRRGDVIAFDLPRGVAAGPAYEGVTFVKRCVALPGDTLAVRGGMLFVNGRPAGAAGNIPVEGQVVIVPREGTVVDLRPPEAGRLWKTVLEEDGCTLGWEGGVLATVNGEPAGQHVVGEDHLFVVGDNRDASYDSRDWGMLPLGNVIGQVVVVYWSADPALQLPGSIRWDRIGRFVR